jgi:hypothetical protein
MYVLHTVQVEMCGVVLIDFTYFALCLSIVTIILLPPLAIKFTSVREHSFMGCIIYRTFYTEDESLKKVSSKGRTVQEQKFVSDTWVGDTSS